MKTYQKVILTIGIVLSVIATLVGLSIGILILGIKQAANDIQENIDNKNSTQRLYDSIPEELMEQGLFPADLKLVGTDFAWAGEWPDKTHQIYFYIAEDQYDQYKSYWLEGVDEADYTDHYNTHLAGSGAHVFQAISVDDYLCTEDREEGNVLIKANVQYYSVNTYNSALYYETLSAYGSDKDQYLRFSNHAYDEYNPDASYMLHQEDGRWVIEEMSLD